MRDISTMLAPKSIAIIGASNKPSSVGNELVKRIIEARFKGKIYPINLHETTIEGLKCYPNVAAVKSKIDLAIIAVPAAIVLSILEECHDIGTKNAVIISSGFSETGASSAGAKLENQIKEYARITKMNILGPNCLGLINLSPNVSMNACFAPIQPVIGTIGFATQSGALASGVINLLPTLHAGFSQMVSLGNQCQIDAVDVLSAWEKEENVHQVAMYLESIPDMAQFKTVATKVAKKKPVIVIKAGTSKRGSMASVSHTGHLAGDDATTDGMLASAGVIRETSLQDMFNVARVFECCPLPKGDKIAILTNAGGPGILATDCAEKCHLPIADLTEKTQSKLRAVLNKQASVHNPVDVIADASAEQYETAAEILLNAPEVDILFVIYLYIAGKNDISISEYLSKLRKKYPTKPIISVFMTTPNYDNEIKKALPKYDIPTFRYVDDAMHCVMRLVERQKYLTDSRIHLPEFNVKAKKVAQIFETAQKNKVHTLSTLQSLLVFEAYGLPVPKFASANSLAEAKKVAATIGYPVVLKISSKTITHKSDIGGVITNIKNEAELTQKWKALIENLSQADLLKKLDCVVVMQQVKGGSRELVAGVVKKDNLHQMMFGLGGIFVEAFKEIAFRPCPLSYKDAHDLLYSTRAITLLGALRGLKATAPIKMEAILLRISQLITDFPQILELDANPIMIANNGTIHVVDARITI